MSTTVWEEESEGALTSVGARKGGPKGAKASCDDTIDDAECDEAGEGVADDTPEDEGGKTGCDERAERQCPGVEPVGQIAHVETTED